MLKLHDRTRRRIALAIFFTLGLMPTLAVSAWGVWWRSPRYAAGEAEQLGWRLGMLVSLSGVRHPEPGVVVYEGLQVREPEGNQPVFRCRAVEARWNEPSGKSNGRGLRLLVSQPEINALQWGEVARLVDCVLTRRTEADDVPLHVTAEELRLSGRDLSQKLAQVDVQVEPHPGGPQVQVSFRLAETTGAEPVRLLLTRNREVTPHVTAFELDTGATPLPCRLLAIGLAEVEILGPRASFCGTLRTSPSADGPTGELAGQFADVDLERLASDRSPHQVSGLANVTVETARFKRGRLETATVSLAARSGTVSRSLLEAAERLGMPCVELDRLDQPIRYEQLAVSFDCDARGVRVRGMSSSGDPGTILTGRLGPILGEPQPRNQPLPLDSVVQAFAPEAEKTLVPIALRPSRLMSRPPMAEPNDGADGPNPLR